MPTIEEITETPGPIIEELDEEEELEGERVELLGLQAKPELNGRRGEALRWDPKAKRMGIKLDDGKLLSVRMANMRVVPLSDEERLPPAALIAALEGRPPPPRAAPTAPTPAAVAQQESKASAAQSKKKAKNARRAMAVASKTPMAPLMVSIAGPAFDALRPALEEYGFIQSVSTAKGGTHMSASIEQIVELMGIGRVSAAAIAQALATLGKVAPTQGERLLDDLNGPGVAAAAMQAHLDDAPLQMEGAGFLRALAVCCGEAGVEAVLEAGGVATAVRAMKRHPAEASVQLSICELLETLCGTGGDQSGDDGPRPTSHAVWKAIDKLADGTDDVCALAVGAMRQHREHATLQAAGCRLLTLVAHTGGPGQATVCQQGGAKAAVQALEGLGLGGRADVGKAEGQQVRQLSAFLLANLASGDAECKTAVGEAGAPRAFAEAIRKLRGDAEVLRLTIGALSQLSQVEAGRRFVIDSDAPAAVATGMRAHASDVVVLQESCFFIAALAYGGDEGRKAANDAGLDSLLAMAIKRFGGTPSHAKTIEMAKTIVARLQQ